ncbi:MAG: hypothetical protein JWN17_2246 [Frankiales bacterium]|nr:hypothetical protein [Frankiales bacterium]
MSASLTSTAPTTTRPAPLLRRALVLLLSLLAAWSLLGTAPASAAGDDYPYRADTSGSADRWGFTRRQCVSFVAWRMEQRGRALSNATQKWGSALSWDEAARRLGYGIGTRPVAGAIAQWNAGERSAYYAPGSATANGTMTAGGYGHVAYVRGVYSDGSVSVEQYNTGGDRSYGTMRVKAPRYLYVGVHAPA